MRILHVIVGLADAWGGPPRALATIARAQAARGDDVVVFPCVPTLDPPTLPPGRYGRLTVLPPPASGSLKFPSPALRRAVRDAARDRDIVHVHGTWRDHVPAAAGAARSHGIPYILRPAGNLGEVCRGSKWYLKRPYFELIERRIFNRAAAIHCTSRKEAAEIAPLGLRPRMFVVPQPVEIDVEPDAAGEAELFRLCPNLDAAANVILYMGRIQAIKSLDVLLEAFILLASDFPGWRLVLAGFHEDAVLASSLRTRAAEAGLADRVHLPGMARGSTKAALLSRAAIFAQPSQHENFGLSVAEALHFGVPCVVSNGVALAPDIVAAGAGTACESRAESFSLGLRALMTDVPRRREQSENARRLALRFTPASVADQLDAEYRACSESTSRTLQEARA